MPAAVAVVETVVARVAAVGAAVAVAEAAAPAGDRVTNLSERREAGIPPSSERGPTARRRSRREWEA